jgi:hypothetical protein
MVITYPRIIVKAIWTNSYFRDVRQHHHLNILRELESIDWNTIIMDSHNIDEITIKFYEIIWPKFDKSFTLTKVRTSSRDPPFMSPLVNHLLNQRKRAIQNGNTEADTQLHEKINKLFGKIN